MIEPFKYLIQAVAIERDDKTGRVIREHPAEIISVFSAEQAVQAIMEFEHQLALMTADNGGTPIKEDHAHLSDDHVLDGGPTDHVHAGDS